MMQQQKEIDIQLVEAIEENYSIQQLVYLWENWISPFYAKHEMLVKQALPQQEWIDQSDLSKMIACFFAIILEHTFLLRLFCDTLPDFIRELFSLLAWKKELSFEACLTKFSLSREALRSNDACQPLSFFCVEKKTIGGNLAFHSSFFFLPFPIKRRIQSVFPLPSMYHFIPATIDRDHFVYENKGAIIDEIILQAKYLATKSIRLMNTGLPSKPFIRNMQNALNIEEFYPPQHREYHLLRSTWTTLFHVHCQNEKIALADPIDWLKAGIEKSRELIQNYPHYFLPHIKGNFDLEMRKEGYQNLMQLLRTLPLSEWISIENIVEYATLREIDLTFFPCEEVESKLFFSPAESESFGFMQMIPITQEYYQLLIVEPLIKSCCFFLASLGLLDIHYSLPSHPLIQTKNEPSLSPFDGLLSIRLTEIGAHLFGKEGLNSSLKEESRTSLLSFEENALMVKLDCWKEHPISRLVEEIGQKTIKNYYQIDFISFFGNCSDQKQAREKKELLLKYAPENLPQIWKDFFDQMEKRILKSKDKKVFQLDYNPDLIEAIESDEILSSLILRAEDYHIMVEQSEVASLQKRLKELGFFLPVQERK